MVPRPAGSPLIAARGYPETSHMAGAPSAEHETIYATSSAGCRLSSTNARDHLRVWPISEAKYAFGAGDLAGTGSARRWLPVPECLG